MTDSQYVLAPNGADAESTRSPQSDLAPSAPLTHRPGCGTEEQGARPSPDRILELSSAYWASRTLLSAAEVGLFAALSAGPLRGDELRERLGLHPRGARDFFDALVALGFLERDHCGYRNTPETSQYLDPGEPSYIGGMLDFHNTSMYAPWASLTEALRTGESQNRHKNEEDGFAAAYADPEEQKALLTAMSGFSAGSAIAIADAFPWARYETFCDLGTAQGMVPVQLALRHPHLRGVGFDLPQVGPIFEEFVAGHDLGSRVTFAGGDFFADPLPEAQVYVLGHVLHDWGMDAKRSLLCRTYEALPDGGAVIVYEMLIDDDRRTNAAGLLMSLNMLVLSAAGFDYTGADCREWMADAGFRESYVRHLVGPESMVVGLK